MRDRPPTALEHDGPRRFVMQACCLGLALGDDSRRHVRHRLALAIADEIDLDRAKVGSVIGG
jgi:hypothetical protein